jgi:hypothetical protein
MIEAERETPATQCTRTRPPGEEAEAGVARPRAPPLMLPPKREEPLLAPWLVPSSPAAPVLPLPLLLLFKKAVIAASPLVSAWGAGSERGCEGVGEGEEAVSAAAAAASDLLGDRGSGDGGGG